MSAQGHRRRPPCIALDFDGTLIREHVPVAWVLFLLRRSGWPAGRRFSFLLKSIARGAAAMALSRWPACAPLAVRAAFAAFRGVEEESLEKLVDCRKMRRGALDAYVLNLNPAVTAMLGEIVASWGVPPEIRIYSQGSSREVIRQFLGRTDVRERFAAIGIQTPAIAVYANVLETDGCGCFTGVIRSGVLTKFSRPAMLPEHAIFIGDDGDEGVFRRVGGKVPVRFINWRRHGRYQNGRGFDIPARPLI